MFLKKVSHTMIVVAGLAFAASNVAAQTGRINPSRPLPSRPGPIPMNATIDPWGDNEQLLRDLQNRLDGLRRDDRRLGSEISDLQSRESSRRSDATRSRDQLKRSEGQLTKLNADALAAGSQVARLQAEVARARDLRDQEIRQLTQTIAQVQSEIPRLESQLQQLENQVAKLNSERNPKRIQVLQSEIAQVQAALAKKQLRLKEVETNWESFKNCQANECIPIIMAIQNEMTSLKQEIAKLNSEIAQKQTEIASLESIEKQYNEKVSERDAKQSEIQEKRVVAMTLQGRLSTVQNQVIPQEAQLAQAQARLSSLEAQRPGLQAQVERNRSDLQVIERDLQTISVRLQEAQQDRDVVSREIRALEFQITEIRNKPIVDRVVVVGSSVPWQLSQELSRHRLTLVSAESTSQDVSKILNARDSVVYVLADSLNPSAVQPSIVKALEDVIRGGGLVIVAGDPDRLTGLTDAQELRSWIGVESTFSNSTSEVVGSGLLRGLDARSLSFQRVYELRPQAGAFSPEVILQDSSRRVVGTASSIASNGWQRGRVLVLGFELQNLALLKSSEVALCSNLRGSSEGSAREICR